MCTFAFVSCSVCVCLFSVYTSCESVCVWVGGVGGGVGLGGGGAAPGVVCDKRIDVNVYRSHSRAVLLCAAIANKPRA